MTSDEQSEAKTALAALRHRGFALFWGARVCTSVATQIVSVAVGWQVYDLTRNPFDLGLVGLVEFAPALVLVLVTGAVSDRYPRRFIVAITQLIEGACAATLLFMVAMGSVSIAGIFATLFVFGVARAFMNPASQSLIANLVPANVLASAIALSASTWQVAAIAGPAAGGLLYGLSPSIAYGTALVLFVVAAVLMLFVPKPPQKVSSEPATWSTVIAGFRYVWHEKIVLGAISLDLFAVLFSGAVALLPVFARDILEVGPWGLGLLRAAPGIGALAVALYLAFRPIRDHAGLIMFVCVFLFGLFTALFGLSTATWLSIAALALAGAVDMVSVYIRETLIQLWTPDAVRGRVNAVNMVFVGASNEIGVFRAGSVASLIGAVPAVVLGGVGAMGIAILWAYLFPSLRHARHLSGRV